MNNKKKIMLFLVVLFLFGFIVKVHNVLADVQITTGGASNGNGQIITNTGSFSIKELPKDNEKFYIYKILDAYYNTNTQEVSYDFTQSFKAFIATQKSNDYTGLTVQKFLELEHGDAVMATNTPVVSAENITSSSKFSVLMGLYANYVKTNSVSQTAALTTTGRTAVNDSVAVGTYMALPVSTEYVYSVMVTSVTVTRGSVNWTINDGIINAKYVTPSVSKVCYTEPAPTPNTVFDVQYDKAVNCKVTATVPKYPGSNVVNGTAEGTISIKASTQIENLTGLQGVTVKLGETPITISSTSSNSSELKNSDKKIGTITWTLAGLDVSLIPTEIYSQVVEISYSYTPLVDQTHFKLGTAGNDVSATLKYPDPYATSIAPSIEKRASATAYTYALQITGNQNAEFDVYLQYAGETKVGHVVIDSTGYGYLVGLESGKYTIRQTKSPTGRNLPDIKNIEVGKQGTEIEGKTGYYNVTAMNEEFTLPYTGGIGRVLFMGIGLVLIIGAVVAIVIYQKKKKQNAPKETI